MFSILGRPGRLCDTPSRRELLTVGSLGLVGLGLPDWHASRVRAQGRTSAGNGFGRAQGIILLYLQGSPSHIDLWDPKPDSLAEIRGEFHPIATSAPGIRLSETLPLLARQADK